MSEFKLTIITINYNNASGLLKTIESVVMQKDVVFEFIVIDGGSTDGSVKVIERFKDKINYWISEKDSGIYNAMNKGIKASNGEFLLFLNSGDFLCEQDVLKRVISLKLDKSLVYGNMRVNWGNGKITNEKMPDKLSMEHMYKDTLWHPVTFISKKLFDRFGMYDESFKMVADYDFFFKMIVSEKIEARHIPVFITEYNTEGLSSKPENKAIELVERKRVIERYLNSNEIKEIEASLKQNRTPLKKLFNFLKGKF